MGKRLSEEDHELLNEFLGYVLDRHKNGEKERAVAIADIAHLIAAVDLGDAGDDPKSFMNAIINEDTLVVPTGPKAEKRPADVIGNAVHVMRIATGRDQGHHHRGRQERRRRGGGDCS